MITVHAAAHHLNIVKRIGNRIMACGGNFNFLLQWLSIAVRYSSQNRIAATITWEYLLMQLHPEVLLHVEGQTKWISAISARCS